MDHKVAEIESKVLKYARRYLDDKEFKEILPPRVVRASGACENIDTLFEVSAEDNPCWFRPAGKPNRVYLAQTGQLYLEAFVPRLKKVYCVGPSFRAEPRVDRRHLTEFTLIEIEFAGEFDELLEYIEDFINALAQGILSLNRSDLRRLGLEHRINDLKSCPETFPKLTYDEAISQLQDMGEKINWGDDISSRLEKKLVAKYNDQPIFLVRFPDPMSDFGKEIEVEKFFNMIPDKKTPGRVLSADLILPYGGEAVGAAARVYEVGEMKRRLEKSKMFARLEKRGGSLEDFNWYLSRLRNYGSVPHAGCGFGLARIMQWLLGKNDIMEAVTFASNREQVI
jgi:asparaginyl-tRNA synthetase